MFGFTLALILVVAALAALAYLTRNNVSLWVAAIFAGFMVLQFVASQLAGLLHNALSTMFGA